MVRALGCVFVSVALAVLCTAPALAKQHKSVSCNSHRAHTVKRSAKVLVWRRHTGFDIGGGDLFTLYACLRPAGKSIKVGQTASGGGEFIGNDATSHLTLTGTQVSDLFTTGLASQAECYKDDPTNPECVGAASSVAQVFRLGKHHSLSLSQDLATASIAYAFSTAGAIAWEAPVNPHVSTGPLMLQAITFAPSSLTRGTVQTLDTGSLGDSIQFSGLTVSWTNAGQSKSETLS